VSIKHQLNYELVSVQKAVNELIHQVAQFVKDSKSYDVSLMNSDSKLDLEVFTSKIKEALPHIRNFTISNITPALAIHTGPEALGIAVSIHS